jgi:hypothetical protein
MSTVGSNQGLVRAASVSREFNGAVVGQMVRSLS